MRFMRRKEGGEKRRKGGKGCITNVETAAYIA